MQAYLKQHTTLSDDDITYIISKAVRRTLQRGELLLQEGQVCRHKIFIEKGLLRTFGTTGDGSEHVLKFSPEHSWTLDVESYDKQIPALLNIAAIEPSEVFLWTKAGFEEVLNNLPQMKTLAQGLISRNIYDSRQRLLTALSGTPEDKYEEFVRNYPGLLPRLPLHMIASYLGISLKTLTRLRHAQAQR